MASAGRMRRANSTATHEFADWLAAHRQQGPISLVLLMDKGEMMNELALPKPDNSYVLGRVVFIQYLPQ